MSDGVWLSMLVAIGFNNCLEQEADKFGKRGSERDLPSKIRAMQRQTVPKMPP